MGITPLSTAASPNRQFLICRLSNTGVSPPVIQNIPGCPLAPTVAMYGYLKGSCNGRYLAAAFGNGTSGAVGGANNRVELFGFNSTTGTVTNYIQTYPINSAYGIEFSPNGNYLFCSGLGASTTFGIVNQYALSAPFSTNTINSIQITNPLGYDAGALQLAPNGKIYLAKEGEQSLDAFNSPNLPNWGYQQNAILQLEHHV
jgi:hypothetical protein